MLFVYSNKGYLKNMQNPTKKRRPLSPHLSIYRPEFTSVTSIFTRITGNALLISALVVVWWLYAASTTPEKFENVNRFFNSWVIDLVMFASLWAVWYHFLAGLRHIYWDSGKGFELSQAKILAYGVIFGSLVLTLVTVLIL